MTKYYLTEEQKKAKSERTSKQMYKYFSNPANKDIQSKRMIKYFADPRNKKKIKERCEKISKGVKKYYENQENRDAVSKRISKYYSDPKNRKKHSVIMKGKAPWNKGKKGMYSKEHIQYLKKVLKMAAARPETKKRMRAAAKKRMKNPEYLKNWITGHKKFYTAPELKMMTYLKNLYVEFIPQYYVSNIKHCYRADFFLPDFNIVIEVDGVYWHNYPRGNDIDYVRTAEMKSAGYTVHRFWEKQFDLRDVERRLMGEEE